MLPKFVSGVKYVASFRNFRLNFALLDSLENRGSSWWNSWVKTKPYHLRL